MLVAALKQMVNIHWMVQLMRGGAPISISMNISQSISKRWLAAVVVLQAATLLTLWGAAPSASRALADGIPDSGAQREQIIEQLKGTNERLDKLLSILSGGDLHVRLTKADDAAPHR